MWIHDARDPKKAWLEMKYCIAKEEVDWIVKYWPVQRKLPISKPTTRAIMKQSSRPKEKDELGSSARTNSLADKTRKDAVQNLRTRSNVVLKKSKKNSNRDKNPTID
jgi:hypothetical protein